MSPIWHDETRIPPSCHLLGFLWSSYPWKFIALSSLHEKSKMFAIYAYGNVARFAEAPFQLTSCPCVGTRAAVYLTKAQQSLNRLSSRTQVGNYLLQTMNISARVFPLLCNLPMHTNRTKSRPKLSDPELAPNGFFAEHPSKISRLQSMNTSHSHEMKFVPQMLAQAPPLYFLHSLFHFFPRISITSIHRKIQRIPWL